MIGTNYFIIEADYSFHASLSIEIPAPHPRGIAADSGDLTRPMLGFNAHLTTCGPRGVVELIKYELYPGRERGFNRERPESKAGTALWIYHEGLELSCNKSGC